MKTYSYKRIVAYILDILIVTVVATLLTMFVPSNEKYESALNEYIEITSKLANNEIKQDEYVPLANDLVYTMNKESLPVTIVTVVVTIIYFVVINYYLDGETLGKKLMKIKIVSNNDSNLTMNNYLIRALIINSVLMNILGIIFILVFDKENYLQLNDITTYAIGAVYIVTFIMILFRKDGRGLHDLLANTKVVSLDENKENLNSKEEEKEKNKVTDAEIIGEK